MNTRKDFIAICKKAGLSIGDAHLLWAFSKSQAYWHLNNAQDGQVTKLTSEFSLGTFDDTVRLVQS
jgi:hypothetical protein